jgi:hypothetical protein
MRPARYPRHERTCLGPLAPPEAAPNRAAARGELVCMSCPGIVTATPAQLRQAQRAERQYRRRLAAGELGVEREASPRRTYAPRNAQRPLFEADVLPPRAPRTPKQKTQEGPLAVPAEAAAPPSPSPAPVELPPAPPPLPPPPAPAEPPRRARPRFLHAMRLARPRARGPASIRR